MFKGINSQKFHKIFQSENDCRQYLYNLKWEKGYTCFRCGHRDFWKGRKSFNLRCKACDYDESVCSNTIFHKLKIPLLKAFGMAFQIVAHKKGRSSADLAKDFEVGVKTAWAFRKKVQKAMAEDASKEIKGLTKAFVLDSIIVTHRGILLNGFQRINFKIQKRTDPKSFKDHLVCYHSLPNNEEISFSHLIGGKFKEQGGNLLLWNFKAWLTGVHHHCSMTYLGGYIDEFFFKYNNRKQTEEIWHSLMSRIINSKPSNSFG